MIKKFSRKSMSMIFNLIRLYFILSVTFLFFTCLHTFFSDESSATTNRDFIKLFNTNEQSSEVVSNNDKSEAYNNVDNNSSSPIKNGFSRSNLNSGEPPIYILWTRWRSGSSFLGQILAYAKKNTFYSYEPLHAFGLKIMSEEDKKTKLALKFLFNSMRCRYDLYGFLVNYFIETEFYYFYNPMTKNTCRPVVSCNSSTILNQYCEEASTQVIKLLRLSLKYGEYILEKNQEIKIIYLARDPRAVFLSRWKLPWCTFGLDDCRDPKTACELLQSDVDYAVKLHRLYPERFLFIRYEDLALSPDETFRSIWEKLGEEFTDRIARLIEAHTSSGGSKQGLYGLQKNSKERAFNWRASMSYKQMSSVQDSCRTVMKNLGYSEYSSEHDYADLRQQPLKSFWNSSLNEFSLS